MCMYYVCVRARAVRESTEYIKKYTALSLTTICEGRGSTMNNGPSFGVFFSGGYFFNFVFEKL